jgi:protein ImuA
VFAYSIISPPAVSQSLSLALNEGAVWRADALARPAGAVAGTGFAALDAQLPGGGWPVGAMVELLQAQTQHNEWRLLLPALVRQGRLARGAVALVGAPHVPFGPGLAGQGLNPQTLLWINTAAPLERLWAAEQALRCADVTSVLAWLPQARADQLRRLQMAAADHLKLLFVMRSSQVQDQASPAVLRLQLAPGEGHTLELQLLKRRGPPLDQPLLLQVGPARLAALLAVCSATATAPAGWLREADDALDRTEVAA